jgi:hypothetical protein
MPTLAMTQNRLEISTPLPVSEGLVSPGTDWGEDVS